MDDDALLATALDGLARRYDLERKRRREPELNEILKEFVARLRGAFGSLEAVRGKRILGSRVRIQQQPLPEDASAHRALRAVVVATPRRAWRGAGRDRSRRSRW